MKKVTKRTKRTTQKETLMNSEKKTQKETPKKSLEPPYNPIADWENVDEYPNKINEEPCLWAWEFLRRNPDYQRDYVEFLDEIRLYEAGRGDADKLLALDFQLQKKWGVSEIKDPTSPDYPFFSMPGRKKEFELEFTFLLTAPIAPQIEMARRVLNHYQECLKKIVKENQLEGIQKLKAEELITQDQLERMLKEAENGKSLIMTPLRKFHRDLLPKYLRLLDAETAKITQDAMAAILYPNVDLSKARFKIKDQLKTARELREEGFRYLVPSFFSGEKKSKKGI